MGEEYCYEAVRLSSFKDLPNLVPVRATRLARSGFYYIGNGDEVACFSCGGRLKEWTHGDDPFVRHYNFFPDCPLMKGTETKNVPLFQTDDAISNGNIGTNDDPFPNLARSSPRDHGGNASLLLSSQQALSRPLGIISPEVATPQITHVGVASGVRSNDNTSAPSTPPNTPWMRNESDRLATFVSWPSGGSVRPKNLARAGFFYLGTEDRVQCAFCEGVLRNWELGDQPMQKHRRYFSSCPFVLGLEVGNIPLEEPSTTLPPAVSASQRHAVGGRTTGSESDGFPNLASLLEAILEIEDEMNRQTVQGAAAMAVIPQEEPGQQPLVPALSEVPAFVATQKTTQTQYSEKQSKKDKRKKKQDTPVPKENDDKEIKSLREENKRLKEERICKICMDEEASVVFVPCGHLVACVQCAPALRNCAICRTDIEDRVRSKLSVLSLQDGILNNEDEMIRQTAQGAAAMGAIPQEEPGQQLVPALAEVPAFVATQKTSQMQNSEKQSKKDNKKKKKKQGAPVPKESDDKDATTGPTLGIPTARPRHERYAIEHARVQTFANWPPSCIPRPEALARAGFFYEGFNETVTCFFCDGGLRNWKPQHDPWTEHKRWFPHCDFVRQCKGDAFIQMIKEPNSPNNPPPQPQVQAQRAQGAPGSYHVDAREIKARLATPTVQAVLDMGFRRDTVSQAIEHRLRNSGDDFHSAESLLDAVLNIEDVMTRQTAQGAVAMAAIPQEEPGQQPLVPALSEVPASVANQKTFQTQNSEKQSKKDKKKKKKKQDAPVPKESEDKETKSLLEENKRLKEERICKICMDKEASVVFVPCGHLVACVQCATALRNCTICRTAIKGTVRSILS